MSVQFASRQFVALLALLLINPYLPKAAAQRPGEGGGGGSCSVTVMPPSLSVLASGGSVTVSVAADDMYCSWTVVSEADWIVPNVTSGYGDGTVTLTIAPAPGGQICSPRGGVVRVNSTQIPVQQSGYIVSDCLGNSGRDDGCCATKAASLVTRGGDALRLARRYRDEVLLRSPRGAEYVRAYYDHTGEAVMIASADPWLLLRTARALKRHTANLQRAVDGGNAIVTEDDLEEFDSLAAEYEAAASPALRDSLASFRRDLRDPERLMSVGVRVERSPSSQLDKQSVDAAADGFADRLAGLAPAGADVSTRLLRIPDLLAVAARTRLYARWYARHGSEAVATLVASPLLALRFAAVSTRLMPSLDSLVETGTARIEQANLDDLGEVLDRLADRLDPESARTLRLVRRDLRSRQTLAAGGVVVDRNRFAFSPAAIRAGKASGFGTAPSGFLGGTGDDVASAATVDAAGNVIVVGATAGNGFTLVNAVQPQYRGAGDAFVTKFSPDGQIVFSTYLGGTAADVASAVSTDSAGNIYVCGTTESTNFPAPGGYQRGRRGSADAFVVKLDPAGSTVVYGTFLGGTSVDGATGIAVDASGRAFVTGATTSGDFPVTSGVVDRDMTGVVDGFVARLSSSGAALEASTMLGGQGRDGASSIGIDASGNVVVAGVTSSLDFPQIRPVQSEFGGLCDGFVTKLNSGLTSFVYSTWLGGSDVDGVGGMALDSTGAVVVTGATASSTDFPVRSAVQSIYGGGFLDAFVARIPPTGGSLDYSTYLGGSDDDRGYRLSVDASGTVAVAGLTASTNFPSVSAGQPAFGGGTFDAFVAQFAPSGSSIRMSTFVGGSVDEAGVGLAITPGGSIVATGETSSPDFPASTALGSFDGGPADGFIVSISAAPQVPPPVVESVSGLVQSGKPFRVKITGSNFQAGALVYIGESSTAWPSVKSKGSTQLLLRKGATLEAAFPAGVPTDIRIVNPDGGAVTVTFTR